MAALILALVLGAGPSGQVAFVSCTEQEDQCVCVLDVATRAVTRVGEAARDGAPRWSPDGKWLAFETAQSEGMGIRVVGADGSQGRTLRHQRLWNRHPRWSPEGRRLAYSASEEMSLAQVIVVYDLDAKSETEWAGGRRGLLRPVWVPTLAMLRVSGEEELRKGGVIGATFLEEAHASGVILALGLTGYRARVENEDPTPPENSGESAAPGRLSTDLFVLTRSQVTPLLARDTTPRNQYIEWAVESNDEGTQFAYDSNDGGDREILVLGKRGIADVSNHRSADWNPVWSPEAGWLAFESFRDGRRGIYRVYVDTGRIFPVAISAAHDCWAPAWSPDGEWIVFVSDQTGTPELYICDKTGAQLQRLTSHPGLTGVAGGGAFAPAWRPEKRK